MARVRHHRNAGSESIPWATLQDAKVSYLARGLLGHCLSLPPDWDFSADRIATQGKSEFREGVVAIRRAFKELEEAGYRRLVTERNDRGQFDTYADFAPVPVPEWIEEYHARAARAKRRKKPGPKTLSATAKAAAAEAAAKGRATRTNQATDQDDSTFPQVAPEVRTPQFGEMNSGQPGETGVSAGRTGSAYTAVRSTQLQRGTPTETTTHTPATPVTDASSAVDVDGVCVSIDEIKTVTNRVVETIPVSSRKYVRATGRARIAASVRGCLERGHTPDVIVTEADTATREGTTHPVNLICKTLSELQAIDPGEAVPQVTPEAQEVPERRVCPDCGEMIERTVCLACVSERKAAAVGSAR